MKNLREREERSKEDKENQQQQQQPAREAVYNRKHRRCALLSDMAITAGDVYEACARIGGTDADADNWIEYMNQTGWVFSNGYPVTLKNFRRPLRMWIMTGRRMAANGESDEAIAARYEAERKAAAKKREKERFNKAFFKTERAWSLCAERCANCEGVGCAAGVQTPPAHREEPYPPEDCPKFVERKEVA